MRRRRVRIASGHLDPLAEGLPRSRRPAAARRHAGRRASRLRYVATAIGIAVFGLLGVAVANLYLLLSSTEVGDWIAPRASAALHRPVTLGAAGLAIWPRPSLRVTDVEVGNLAGFDGPALARIGAARLDLSWLPLLIGRIHVRRVTLDGVQVHLALDEQGTSNFGDLVPSSEVTSRPLPDAVALKVQEMSLSGGSLTYFDARSERLLALSGIDAEAVLARSSDGGWRSSLAAHSDSLLLRLSAADERMVWGAGPRALVIARRDRASGTIRIDEGHVVLAQDTLHVHGAVSIGTPDPSYDLLLTSESFSAGSLASFLPLELQSELPPEEEESVRVTVRLRGGANTPPSLRGSVR